MRGVLVGRVEEVSWMSDFCTAIMDDILEAERCMHACVSA